MLLSTKNICLKSSLKTSQSHSRSNSHSHARRINPSRFFVKAFSLPFMEPTAPPEIKDPLTNATPIVHEIPINRVVPDLPRAPPIKASLTEFLNDVEQDKISRVFIRQDKTLLRAINTEGYQEVVTLPFDIPIVEYLLEKNIAMDIVSENNNGGQIINTIFIVVQIAFLFFIIRAIFGGGGNGTGGGGMMGGGGGFGKFLQSDSKVVDVEKTNIKFSDVAGIDNAKRDLQEVVDFLKNPEKYTKVGAKVPRGVILHGPPGTGKTLLAKAVAGEAGVPFIACSGSAFVEMFVGVGASRIRDLFKKAAEKAPCIVFIDEIDSVGKKRGASMQGNDERDNTINQLLTLMDGFEDNSAIILLAATNRLDLIDEALLRPGRFDRHVMVETPDLKGREAILEIHTKNKPLDENVDIKSIAQTIVGFSGADIQNLANEAAIYAARENSTKITKKHFDMAFEKIILGEEKRTMLITDKKKQILAYHEAGHTVMGLLMKDYDVVKKVSIIPRGKTGGATYFEPSEDRVDMSLLSKTYLKDKMVVALGGRVAEELTFGTENATTGASGDLQEVYKLAHHYVAMFGFGGSELGPVYWGPESYNHEAINKEITNIVTQQYNRATKLMQDNKELLESIANALLEKENIDQKDITEIYDKYIATKHI